ncbi:MAG: helix-turn-helix transcriptional regulator [Candidatus Eremiobacteraeota bacterium]|nr:helix-turn-helix transcriptional regulator [Candidatus Eremiobacteraeota bacterium]
MSSGVLCREFIGRGDELAYLSARLRPAARRSALVIVRGEAGVGKTRLVGELIAAAGRAGVRTTVTAVREYANAPYSAVAEALETLGASAGLERDALAGEGDEKTRRFSSVAATFAQIARASGGLLVVLEDLHWADGGTIELLRFLAQRTTPEHVTFVATYRIDDADAERLRGLAALEREADGMVTVEPLAASEMDRLLRAALAETGRTLPVTALERIRELADGRPLVAEELLRGALERRDRDGSAVMVPASVRVTVHERFASLGDEDREVLLHAAVVGRRFSARFVARLTGHPTVAVYSTLRRARDLQLIVEEDDDDGDAFAFRHALTREAVYEELLRAESRALHARVAEALAGDEPLDVSAIAEHAWRARDVEHGIGWNERAGDHACVLFAYSDAARHYARALDLARDPAQRAMLAEKAAESMYATGDVAGAVERLGQAIDALGDDSDANRLALRKAYLLFDQGRYDESVREARAVVDRLENEDSPMRFDAETTAAAMLTARGRAEEALIHLQRADRLATRAEPVFAARFAGNYAYCLGILGRADEARERFAKAQHAARELSDFDVLVRALNNHANVELSYGPIGTARALYDEGLEVARATKNLRFVAWLSQNAALCALIAGDCAAATQHQAHVDGIRHDVDTVIRWANGTAQRLATLVGADDAELREHAAGMAREAIAQGDAPAVAVLAGAVAHDLLRCGKTAEAAALVGDALSVVQLAEAPYWLHDAASRCGDASTRAAARAALATIAQREGARPARGVLGLADAREALRKRDRAEAVAHAEIAVAAFRSAGWRIDEAFALELAGRTADAVALFRAVGALGEVRRLTETGAAATRRRGEATLTAREREIAGLLASGRPTRAIAEVLVISERTVETHIASIYRKLGVSNRAALARLLEESAPAETT